MLDFASKGDWFSGRMTIIIAGETEENIFFVRMFFSVIFFRMKLDDKSVKQQKLTKTAFRENGHKKKESYFPEIRVEVRGKVVNRMETLVVI